MGKERLLRKRDGLQLLSNSRPLLVLAATLGALAVIMGAFGAHGLASILAEEPTRAEWWRTAAHYHLTHALAIGVVAAIATHRPSRGWTIAASCFAAGIAIFSGSLYAMALGGPRFLGAITPIGGALLIAGWVALAICSTRAR